MACCGAAPQAVPANASMAIADSTVTGSRAERGVVVGVRMRPCLSRWMSTGPSPGWAPAAGARRSLPRFRVRVMPAADAPDALTTPWLILPTYNEAENIEAIVAAAGVALAGANDGIYKILIVDDGSPDGTGRIADRLATEREQVEVLH